jgi:hypothetical protein
VKQCWSTGDVKKIESEELVKNDRSKQRHAKANKLRKRRKFLREI